MALSLFTLLTWQVLAEAGKPIGWDRPLAEDLKEHAEEHPWLRHFFLYFTLLGSRGPMGVVAFAGVAVAFLRREYWLGAVWVVVTGGGALIDLGLKASIDRPRPLAYVDPDVHIDHQSFPSGHAMGSSIGYGMWLFVLRRRLKHQARRRAVTLGFVAFIALIGFSRLYLRAHWLTDVLAGYLVGSAWLLLGIALLLSVLIIKPPPETASQ
jgi:undecaprenyl-diphosphatase